MKKRSKKIEVSEIIKEYPIADKLDGWFFSLNEVSPGMYEIKGTDQWNRQVGRTGFDPEKMLEDCIEDAKEIIRRIKN